MCYRNRVSILLAGSSGLVGSGIKRKLDALSVSYIEIHSDIVNLLDREQTIEFVQDHRPDVVIDAAAKVGGIGANSDFPVDFLLQNLTIQSNLMEASHLAAVDRFVFLGSSCIYPRNAIQPIKEEFLLSGPLEKSNSAYAIAKIAGIELVRAYRKQFGRHWISLMPTNIYGPNDNFNLLTAHVLPALINRFYSAKEKSQSVVSLWGTGKPRREFLHSDDLASAVLLALEKYDDDLHLNVGSGSDISIFELSQIIAELTGFEGLITWDTSKPDGTPRKLLDISRISALGWKAEVELSTGIKETLNWFKNALAQEGGKLRV